MMGGFVTEIVAPRAISGRTADASHHVPLTRNAGIGAASRERYASMASASHHVPLTRNAGTSAASRERYA